VRKPVLRWLLTALGGFADSLRLAPVIRPRDRAFGNLEQLGKLFEGGPLLVAQLDDLG
jgi:hypothetical protein